MRLPSSSRAPRMLREAAEIRLGISVPAWRISSVALLQVQRRRRHCPDRGLRAKTRLYASGRRVGWSAVQANCRWQVMDFADPSRRAWPLSASGQIHQSGGSAASNRTCEAQHCFSGGRMASRDKAQSCVDEVCGGLPLTSAFHPLRTLGTDFEASWRRG
jgi:hypothetical protein